MIKSPVVLITICCFSHENYSNLWGDSFRYLSKQIVDTKEFMNFFKSNNVQDKANLKFCKPPIIILNNVPKYLHDPRV